MPTRRVAIDDGYLPFGGAGYGLLLLRAVVAEFIVDLDDERVEMLSPLLADARDGLAVPRIALRYRLQTDNHGLDRSRHRIVTEYGVRVLELDVHGRPTPQILGAVMAAAALPDTSRREALQTIEQVVRHGWAVPPGIVERRLLHGVPVARPTPPGVTARIQANGAVDRWRGIPTETRWAMEVLDLGPTDDVERASVQARFRLLVRDAHPDHGGTGAAAADRISELTEARHILLQTAPGRMASGD
ncbi:MAG: hypothetical protein M5U31_02550 [Acidimicrobiia bacterium]|nr:hypothetical protein [Acidimicrobiia bacterium]